MKKLLLLFPVAVMAQPFLLKGPPKPPGFVGSTNKVVVVPSTNLAEIIPSWQYTAPPGTWPEIIPPHLRSTNE